MEDFQTRLGWIPLARALSEIVAPIEGGEACDRILDALALGSLRAKCCADGLHKDFDPRWLDFVMWIGGEDANGELVPTYERWMQRGAFRFNQFKAKERGVIDEAFPPLRADDIVLSLEDWRRLWPSQISDSAKHAPPADVPTARYEEKATDKELDDWMAAYVTVISKRESVLQDCRSAMKVPHRRALAAWNRLPQDQRRGRGNKSKSMDAKSDT